MRTIYEFTRKHPQVCVVVYPLDSPVTEPPKYVGARVEILIADAEQAETDDGEANFGDTLEIEGRASTVREICREILAQLEEGEDDAIAEVERERANAVQCGTCTLWYDRRQPDLHNCPSK
jgi:hypothetical protein